MSWLSGWSYRKKITIQGDNLDSNQTWFPVLVKFTDDVQIGDGARNDGYDIRFTKSDEETLLYYEREYWNGGSGADASGVFWVSKSDWTINADGSTYIYMYYGKSDAPDGEDATNVWDDNYEAVLHLNEDAGAVAEDSTGNGNDAILEGTLPNQIDGKIHKGQDFVSGNLDGMQINDAPELDANYVTIEALVNVDDTAAGKYLWDRRDSEDSFCLYLDATEKPVAIFYTAAGSCIIVSINPVATGSWLHIVATYDGFNGRIYINGVQDAITAKTSTLNQGSSNIDIGHKDTGGTLYNGSMDEFRYSSTYRMVDWLKFEWANINEDDNELTWESEESAPSGYIPKVIMIT